MNTLLEQNCRTVVEICNSLDRQISISSIAKYWTGTHVFINKDVSIALNFLVDKGFLKIIRAGEYEIINPTWNVDDYLESIEAKKRLKEVTLKLAGLQVNQLEKVLSDYKGNKLKSWIAIVLSVIAILISIFKN